MALFFLPAISLTLCRHLAVRNLPQTAAILLP